MNSPWRRPQAMATVDLARPAATCRQAVTWTPVERSAGVPDCAAPSRDYDATMRSAARRPLLALAVALAVAACSGSASASPVVSPAASPAEATTAPAASESAGPSSGASASPQASAASSPVTTTQTTWGRITDAVPAEFPVFPDATVADQPPGGAVSGAWLTTAPVSEVSTWYRDSLLAANWAKVDVGSPLEDGSRVLDIQGDLPECKAQVTVKPFGASTMISVLFGAGCVGGSG